MSSVFGIGETICFFVLPFVGLVLSVIWMLTEKK